jgi:signal peptide peptidase SppA
MTLNAAQQLVHSLVMDGGSRILAIDETRLLHAGRAPRADAEVAADPNAVRPPTSVAVIPLIGALYNRSQWGGPSMAAFRANLAAAVANPDVGAVILDIDSPGGTVAGTPETAAAVRAAGAVKPVTAVVDSLAASAAYWIASQAGSIVVSPSAEVGSIGCLVVHMDLSSMLEAEGIKTTIIRSVPAKAEGNPFEPLSADAITAIKGEVDATHADFVRAVAAGRKTSQANVNETFGQGRTVSAARAVSLGMADRVGTMADVLGGMRTKHAFRKRSAIAFL